MVDYQCSVVLGLHLVFHSAAVSIVSGMTAKGPRAGWIHEVKHDGYRTLLIIERHKASAFTRNGFDWTDYYPNVTKAAAKLDCRSAIIDGEVIVQNKNGVSDFDALKSAIRWRPQSLVFCAFDLLHLNGKDLRDRPLLERRARSIIAVTANRPLVVRRMGCSPGVFGASTSVRAAGPWTTRGWRSERSDNPWLIPSVLVDYARSLAIPSTMRRTNVAARQSMRLLPLTPGRDRQKPPQHKAVFSVPK